MTTPVPLASLRAVLGPGMGQVGIAHRRGDLHDRVADLAPPERRLRPGRRGRTRDAREQDKAGTVTAVAVIQAEIIRGMFIAGTRFWLPNTICRIDRRRAASCDIRTRSIRPGVRPGVAANELIRSERNRASSYPVAGRLGRATAVDLVGQWHRGSTAAMVVAHDLRPDAVLRVSVRSLPADS